MVDQYLKVKGTEDVWAIGDVSDIEGQQFLTYNRQSLYVSKAIAMVLSNKTPASYKAMSSRMCSLTVR